MKILFVTGLYPNKARLLLEHFSNKAPLQEAPNVYQWSIVDGLNRNGVSFEVVSFPFLPSYPFGTDNRMTPSSIIEYKGNVIGEMVSYNSFFLYKKRSIEKLLERYVVNWIQKNSITTKDEFCILTYTQESFFIAPLSSIKQRYPNLIVASIITDMIEDAMSFKSNRTLFKRIQLYFERTRESKLYKYIDKYIFLTQAMVERIPESAGRNIVIEGICKIEDESKPLTKNIFSLFYSGTLESYSGVKELVDAFLDVKIEGANLTICGSGELSSYIKDKMLEDRRIIYLGNIPREKVIEYQRRSSLLINPRRPDNGITRYSFPSKTMEYMVSGTPIIGYKLEGIPEEYYQYMYIPKDLSKESLTETIVKALSLPLEELQQMAENSKRFVLNNKNSKVQVERIVDFINTKN